MSTVFYSHADCRLHDMGPGHPECPQRLDAISDHLLATGLDIALSSRTRPWPRWTSWSARTPPVT
jgi:acetoin utilization deacetylase AcuC-like enzyme